MTQEAMIRRIAVALYNIDAGDTTIHALCSFGDNNTDANIMWAIEQLEDNVRYMIQNPDDLDISETDNGLPLTIPSLVPGRELVNRANPANRVPREQTSRGYDAFERGMYEVIKAYIADSYRQLPLPQVEEAARLTYHYWDDVRYYVPIAVAQIESEHGVDNEDGDFERGDQKL